ncbi:hypothetical protein AB0G74_10685 [Streptomyces sp. NPDC020875]|uniref:nSTAND1 domain-containing NTPase n=1 Tax=Streptomyces sp. NPDC020875 TaxID=3154898 RepID=UPI00340307BB
MAGRPEKPLDPGAGPVQRFAYELRKLRADAGGPTYREMARRAPYSGSVLSRAADGKRLPSKEVALAYATVCGADPGEWERRWHRAADEALSPADDGTASPYPGLTRFEPEDRERFFGRDRLVDDIMRLVGTHRLAALVGASGSGKSSLLRAGLIPRLREPDDGRADGTVRRAGRTGAVRPGAVHPAGRARTSGRPPPPPRPAPPPAPVRAGAPYPRIARVLADTPGPRPTHILDRLRRLPEDGHGERGDVVVLVDQFEEIFTLCQDPAERTGFLDGLLDAVRRPGSRIRVVIAVRADFYARCAEHGPLADALRETTLLLGPMTRAELRRAVVGPARANGLFVERALTDRLVEEVAERPGGLPLLSHVLLETWRRRRGRTLTMEAYEAAGGVDGAIAATAEEVCAPLSPEQLRLVRRVLLRLITPGEGAQDTRRPAPRAEFDAAGDGGRGPEASRRAADVALVLERLARARLITLDDNGVDLAHEALITGWPRLRAWIEEDREGILTHRRLTEAAGIWADLDRDPGSLYRGTRLAVSREWAGRNGHREELTVPEREFLDASAAEEDRERDATARGARRLRGLVLGLVLALVVTAVFGVVAYVQRGGARAAEKEALGAQGTALSRQLAAQALNLVDSRPGTAMLLGVEAYRTSDTPEARGALQSVSARRFFQTELSGHTDAVSHVAYSTRGTLASAGRDGRIVLWDTWRRIRTATLSQHSTWLRTVAFSPDGRRLASGGDDGDVVLWDVLGLKPTATLSGHRGSVKSVAFSPDGRGLATAGDDGTVVLWDSANRRRLTLTGHTGRVWSVEYDNSGRTVATAGADRTVRLWRAADGKPLARLTGHTASVDSVDFSLDGKLLATGGQDHTVRLWDVARGSRVAVLSGHGAEVRSVAFSSDGRTLASGGQDHTVVLWDIRRRAPRATLAGHGANISGLAFNPPGRQLAVAGESGTITLWDATQGPLNGHRGRVHDIAFSPDDRTIATVGQDGATMLWDPERRTRPRVLAEEPGQVRAVAFSPDGRTLATASGVSADSAGGPARPPDPGNQALTLHDLTGRAPPVRLTGHSERLTDVAFSPDGGLVVTASADRTVVVRDARRHTVTARLTHGTGTAGGGVNAVAFSPDGRTLATADYDGRIILWDTARWSRTVVLAGHTRQVRAVAFSPDGRTLASASIDRTVILWDTDRRTRRSTLVSSAGAAHSVAFSPDGRTLATANAETSVMLWDLTDRTLLATLTGHTAQIRAATFSHDGETLATTGDDRTARLWDTDPDHTAAGLCATLARDLTPQEWRQFIPDRPYRGTCGAS